MQPPPALSGQMLYHRGRTYPDLVSELPDSLGQVRIFSPREREIRVETAGFSQD